MMWPDQRLKYLYRVIDQRAGSDQPPLLAVSIHRGVIPRSSITDDLPRAEDLSNYKLCEPGDIVLNRMRAFQGAIGISPARGLVSPDYMVLRVFEGVEARYLHHLFRSTWFVGEMTSRLRGIGGTESGVVRTPRINPEDLGEIRIAVPPMEEQRRIADFLDVETARIDHVVGMRQRQFELMKAKEQGVIAEGIGEPSGGAIKVKYLVGRLTSGPRGWGELVADEGSIFLRITNIPRQGIDLNLSELLRVAAPDGPERERTRTREGDVLVSITADIGSVAVVGSATVDGNVSQHVALLRPDDRVCHPRWLAYAIKSPRANQQLTMNSYGGTKVGLGLSEVGNLMLPRRSRSEQEVAAYLIDSSLDGLRCLRSSLERQIRLFAERRQALITAAVTGQIDVTTSGRASGVVS